MTYDDALAARVRASVARSAGGAGQEPREIAMFGGLCWTVNTHMAVGVGEGGILVHVGKDLYDEALAAGARPMVMGARTMGGVVMVLAADLPDDEALDDWVAPAVQRAVARPPKAPKSAKSRAARRD